MTYLLVLAASAALFACGNVAGKTQCTKGEMPQCVNDQVARFCSDDGTWVAQTCTSDETCMSGSCVARTDLACQPNDSVCMDSAHAVVCNDNGVGFKSVSCPAGTTCQGAGLCVGTCVVGESFCNGSGIVSTCTDGFTYTDAGCTFGQTSCVTTSAPSARLHAAACKPASCVPQDTVCGNKAADPANTDPSYASDCVSSPTGLHWQTTQCAQNDTCVPGNGCSPDCIPGDKRCSGNGIQVCDNTGLWGAITSCNTDQSSAQAICQYPDGSAEPVCGDPVCADYPGACEADGYHPCVNGKVSTTAQACTVGVCVGGATEGGYVGGSCQSECNPGDSKCDGNEAFQTCTAQHRWSGTSTTCPTNGTDRCVQYTDAASGGQRAICGQCAPGSHRCTDASGNPVSSGTDIEACDATGHYGAFALCSVGQCQNSAGDSACVAQCVPGSTVCMGAAPASPPNPTHPGQVNYGTCDNNGNLPSGGGTACASGTSCRKGPNGQPVGVGAAACVVCVGSNITGGNEFGLVDGYCTSGTQLETCQASNTWNSPVTCPTTSPYTGQCWYETAQANHVACGTFYSTTYCTNSYLVSIGYTNGCTSYFGTGYSPFGATPDCCNYYYCRDPYGYGGGYAPEPATCD